MCDSVYVNLQTFLHTMCANARQHANTQYNPDTHNIHYQTRDICFLTLNVPWPFASYRVTFENGIRAPDTNTTSLLFSQKNF